MNFNIPFKRRLTPELLAQWNDIMNIIAHMVRHYEDDEVMWSLTPNKVFSTMSVYTMLENNICGANNKEI
jgi:hypothetical protein